MSHIPKGGMCRVCVYKKMDCSKLNFDKMRVIEKCKDTDLLIVKCDKFQKENTPLVMVK